MKFAHFSILLFLSLVIFSFSGATPAHEDFLQCLSRHSKDAASISKVVYTPNNSSYLSVLNSALRNGRFSTPTTPKPLVIVTPFNISHIQATIYCSKKYKLEMRIRSGGHDFEGLSYVSEVPFIILDLVEFRSVEVDAENKVAWAEAGATIGELYYNIAKKSQTLAFPAGDCHTVGVGGQFSGGGYGLLMRKYGLAADHVIDARLIDVNGRILDRKSMGEDLFWAIRGGGGNTFGIVLAWKLKLVTVPAIVTVFAVNRSLEQNATKIVHRWQHIAHKLPDDIYAHVSITKVNSSQEGKNTIQVTFLSLYLGRVDELIPLVQERFPELGLVKEDCIEMSWVQANLFFGGLPIENMESLLDRNALPIQTYKGKSDYMKQPIPESGFEGIWSRFLEKEVNLVLMIMVGFGGKMDEIPETEIPYPHRAGNLFQAAYFVGWTEEENTESEKYISWIRRLYSYMATYASKSPREAYFNYRDLDIGINSIGYTSYAQASIWGRKYFKNNFDRLVHTKTMVDPENFFKNEQSVPPLSLKKNGH